MTAFPAPAWRPTNAEYHRDRSRWSSSMLEEFHDSPAVAQGLYVAQDLEEPEPNESMILGSAVNLLVVEPERAEDSLCIATQAQSRRGGAYKRAVERYPDRLVLTAPAGERAQAMARSILHPRTRQAETAKALLTAEGYPEWAFKWDDPTGVPCKLKVDRVLNVWGVPTKVALKTTRDPRPESFHRDFLNFGYARRLAFNRRGLRVALGDDLPVDIKVVAVRNREPYDVWVYNLSENWFSIAEPEVEADLKLLAEYLARGDDANWCDPRENAEDSLPVLEPPRHAVRAHLDNLTTDEWE